jgi:hypothetical protein
MLLTRRLSRDREIVSAFIPVMLFIAVHPLQYGFDRTSRDP